MLFISITHYCSLSVLFVSYLYFYSSVIFTFILYSHTLFILYFVPPPDMYVHRSNITHQNVLHTWLRGTSLHFAKTPYREHVFPTASRSVVLRQVSAAGCSSWRRSSRRNSSGSAQHRLEINRNLTHSPFKHQGSEKQFRLNSKSIWNQVEINWDLIRKLCKRHGTKKGIRFGPTYILKTIIEPA